MSAETQSVPSSDSSQDALTEILSDWGCDQETTPIHSRSEFNIRLWQSYLPKDCVETMVRMGWDRST